MVARWRVWLLAVAALSVMGAAPRPRHAAPRRPPPEQFGPPRPPTPFDMCDAATAAARTKAIPPTLLGAIARVESGRPDPVSGLVRPWPWTINVEGVGYFFDTKDAAIERVRALQAKGVKSIDVGCMQVNLMYHPTAFPDLEAAFDPMTNAAYAARFLTALFGQFKDWNLATAAYHSQEQDRGEEYQRRVFGRVMTPMGPARPGTLGSPWPAGVVYGALPPASSMFGAIPPSSSMFGAFAVPMVPLMPLPTSKPARRR